MTAGPVVFGREVRKVFRRQKRESAGRGQRSRSIPSKLSTPRHLPPDAADVA